LFQMLPGLLATVVLATLLPYTKRYREAEERRPRTTYKHHSEGP